MFKCGKLVIWACGLSVDCSWEDFLARANVPDKLAKDLSDPYCALAKMHIAERCGMWYLGLAEGDPSVRLCVTRLLGFIAGQAKVMPNAHSVDLVSIYGLLQEGVPTGHSCSSTAMRHVGSFSLGR